jgi:hypothetical protein
LPACRPCDGAWLIARELLECSGNQHIELVLKLVPSTCRSSNAYCLIANFAGCCRALQPRRKCISVPMPRRNSKCQYSWETAIASNLDKIQSLEETACASTSSAQHSYAGCRQAAPATTRNAFATQQHCSRCPALATGVLRHRCSASLLLLLLLVLLHCLRCAGTTATTAPGRICWWCLAAAAAAAW